MGLGFSIEEYGDGSAKWVFPTDYPYAILREWSKILQDQATKASIWSDLMKRDYQRGIR